MKKGYVNSPSCIYRIFINNYVYIGSTISFKKRKNEHLWSLKRNNHSNQILQNLFNKYGEESINFEIIEVVDKDDLLINEQKNIEIIKSKDELILINILPVAGSSLGCKQSQETIDKKRLSMVGKNKNKKRNEKQILEQSFRQKGRIITEEWRKNISKSMKGKKSPNKPKKFIIYNDKTYTFKEFSDLMGCDLSTLYTTNHTYTEKKYNCKITTDKD
jgi:group I intron endonuclease